MKAALPKFLNVRNSIIAVTLGAIGLLGYPYLANEAVSRGHDGLWQFYLQEVVERILAYEVGWTTVLYGLGIAGIGFGLEIVIQCGRRSALRRLLMFADGSTKNDIFYWLIGVFGLTAIVRFFITLGGASVFVYAVDKMTLDIDLIHRIDSPVLQYLAAFLVMDFMGYVQHRLAHSWGWWWELHKIHHSAETFNMITAYRTHILESLPRSVVYGIAISITGSWQSFVFYAALLEFINLILHSEIQYKWGWLENYLVTPRNHKNHHSVHPEHHNKNFGFTLIVWDRMLGTWHKPRDGEHIQIGLHENPYNNTNPMFDLLTACRNSLRKILNP